MLRPIRDRVIVEPIKASGAIYVAGEPQGPVEARSSPTAPAGGWNPVSGHCRSVWETGSCILPPVANRSQGLACW